jgi:hypothetical protein
MVKNRRFGLISWKRGAVLLLVSVLVVCFQTSSLAKSFSKEAFRGEDGVKPYTHLRFQNNPDNFQFAVMGDRTGGHRPGVLPAAVDLLNLLQPEFVVSVGKVEEGFKESYREFVSLPSARLEFRKLFISLADPKQLPALFHCTTGKDRTGWAAASLLTLLGVPKDKVMEDYLRSNDYILPAYKKTIDDFVAAGGDPEIPKAILGVKKEYLEAAFDEMQKKYGAIDKYFSEGLGIDAALQETLKGIYLGKALMKQQPIGKSKETRKKAVTK